MRGLRRIAGSVGGWWRPSWRLRACFSVPTPSAAQQYFGRNKVQYDNFNFKVLETDHFDFYYYTAEEPARRGRGAHG